MNNPIEVLNEAVMLPELAPPKQGQLARTVLRNHTTQREATRSPKVCKVPKLFGLGVSPF